MNKIEQKLRQAIKDKGVRVLFWDIETSPMLIWTHYIGNKVSINHRQIEKESRIISIQYKFEGDKKVSYLAWDKNQDDSKMLEAFVKILNSATVAIGQNSDAFDYRVLNWRLNLLELQPLAELTTLDTLKLSRSAFRAPAHRLDYRSSQYGFGGKDKMEFDDWIKVCKKDKKALKKMITYGCKDVDDTQKIFWKELPYYKKLPVSLASLVKEDRTCCPRCSEARHRKFDVYPTKIGNKIRWECKNCGNIWKDTRTI